MNLDEYEQQLLFRIEEELMRPVTEYVPSPTQRAASWAMCQLWGGRDVPEAVAASVAQTFPDALREGTMPREPKSQPISDKEMERLMALPRHKRDVSVSPTRHRTEGVPRSGHTATSGPVDVDAIDSVHTSTGPGRFGDLRDAKPTRGLPHKTDVWQDEDGTWCWDCYGCKANGTADTQSAARAQATGHRVSECA